MIVKEYIRLIIELIKDYSITVILDTFNKYNENIRYKLLEAFNSIINKSANVIKIFIFSRDNIDIVNIFYYISF